MCNVKSVPVLGDGAFESLIPLHGTFSGLRAYLSEVEIVFSFRRYGNPTRYR